MSLTPWQLKIRKTGVSASEISAVAGLNPPTWSSAHDVWLDKVGLAVDRDSSAMERGRYLEDGLRGWVGSRIQSRIINPALAKHADLMDNTGFRRFMAARGVDDLSPMAIRQGSVATIRHPDRPLCLATPDGYAVDHHMVPRAVVEIKSPGWRVADHWGDSDEDPASVPIYVACQATWQMAASGLPRAHVGAFIDGDIKVYVVDFNVEFFEALYRQAEDFWGDVQSRVPPPLDASPGARRVVETLYPAMVRSELVVATPEVDALAVELLEIGAKTKELKSRSDAIKTQLIDIIKDNDGIVSMRYGKAYYRAGKAGVDKAGVVDWVREHHPGIISEHTSAPTKRTFRAYFKREKK